MNTGDSAMRFMIMHKTNAHWESGALPSQELIERVGRMIGEMQQAGALLAAEGLRPSSQGARLLFSEDQRTVTTGPFAAANGVPAGFTILGAESIEHAIAWASRFAQVLGDSEIELRPVTEPWDLGLGAKPEGLSTQRFMAIHKTRNPPTLTSGKKLAMQRLIQEMTANGVLLSAEWLQPDSTGVRLTQRDGKCIVTDGPFTESKELIGGFVIVRAGSMTEARAWLQRYADAVGAHEIDVLALSESDQITSTH
jgi:hypothetical protein